VCWEGAVLARNSARAGMAENLEAAYGTSPPFHRHSWRLPVNVQFRLALNLPRVLSLISIPTSCRTRLASAAHISTNSDCSHRVPTCVSPLVLVAGNRCAHSRADARTRLRRTLEEPFTLLSYTTLLGARYILTSVHKLSHYPSFKTAQTRRSKIFAIRSKPHRRISIFRGVVRAYGTITQ
jgi:hypothetical protein